MPEIIKFYRRLDEYGFLSNFWRQDQIVWEKIRDTSWKATSYKTNEHYYQSKKANDSRVEVWIANAPKAYHAMCAGRSLRKDEIDENWEKQKVAVMLIGLRAKFENNELRTKLLDTGDAILIEDSPTDMFWGGSLPKSKNVLGLLLMKVRNEINAEINGQLEEKTCYY